MVKYSTRYVLAQNLRRISSKRRIGLNALADLAGVSRSQMYDVLAKRKSATIDWLDKVADALDVEVTELLRSPDDE